MSQEWDSIPEDGAQLPSPTKQRNQPTTGSRSHPTSEEYLSVLNEEQRQAVVHQGKSLLILAGAGSGKTRVITTKIAYLIGEKKVDPYSILAVTFTKKAAQEMAERAHFLEPRSIHANLRTFHSFGSWFLRQYTDKAGIHKNFTVYDDEDSATLMHKAMPQLNRQEAKALAGKIARAKDYCWEPDSPELYNIDSSEIFPRAYEAYQQRLRETGNIDFGDLIMLPVKLMEQHELIRQHMHRRFSVIMVDEYQDSNTAQFKLLRHLVGDDTYVCVVGDDDQSIYSFRGAEVQNILNFPKQFQGTDIIKLEKNYRSTPQILTTANDSICNNTDRFDKSLKPTRPAGALPALTFLDNSQDETAFCADVIQKAYEKGIPYSDWAVLYRTNAQSLGFETEFLHRKIPYTIVGALKFYDREEIKDALAILSLVANPQDEIAFRRIINKPSRGIGDKTQEKIVELAKSQTEGNFLATCKTEIPGATKKAKTGLADFVSLLENLSGLLDEDSNKKQLLPVEELANQVDTLFYQDVQKGQPSPESENLPVKKSPKKKLSYFVEQLNELSGLLAYHTMQDEVAGTQRVANLQELANSAVLYPMTMAGLLDFLDHIQLDRTLENREDENQDAVTLITVHNTKGLEFPRVILTGLEFGVFPRQDKKEQDLEEERRLFYVGVTRAQNQLLLTSCRKRIRYGHLEEMMPSPFLLEIKEHHLRHLGEIPYSYKALRREQSQQKAKPSVESHPLAAKWKVGRTVYHDDYGYGGIVRTRVEEEEFVVVVKFETGAEKQFMPEYQSQLMITDR
ncbi:MAG: UvrD-helicase domain-containing protein [Treponema sp.]|nr:UvrD-helicase domain-containing protein [Treponema sp.]